MRAEPLSLLLSVLAPSLDATKLFYSIMSTSVFYQDITETSRKMTNRSLLNYFIKCDVKNTSLNSLKHINTHKKILLPLIKLNGSYCRFSATGEEDSFIKVSQE